MTRHRWNRGPDRARTARRGAPPVARTAFACTAFACTALARTALAFVAVAFAPPVGAVSAAAPAEIAPARAEVAWDLLQPSAPQAEMRAVPRPDAVAQGSRLPTFAQLHAPPSAAPLETVFSAKLPGRILDLQFSSDGRWLVAGSSEGAIGWWSAADGRLRAAIQRRDKKGASRVAFDPAGAAVGVVCGDEFGRWTPWESSPVQTSKFRGVELRALLLEDDGAYSVAGWAEGQGVVVSVAPGGEKSSAVRLPPAGKSGPWRPPVDLKTREMELLPLRPDRILVQLQGEVAAVARKDGQVQPMPPLRTKQPLARVAPLLGGKSVAAFLGKELRFFDVEPLPQKLHPQWFMDAAVVVSTGREPPRAAASFPTPLDWPAAAAFDGAVVSLYEGRHGRTLAEYAVAGPKPPAPAAASVHGAARWTAAGDDQGKIEVRRFPAPPLSAALWEAVYTEVVAKSLAEKNYDLLEEEAARSLKEFRVRHGLHRRADVLYEALAGSDLPQAHDRLVRRAPELAAYADARPKSKAARIALVCCLSRLVASIRLHGETPESARDADRMLVQGTKRLRELLDLGIDHPRGWASAALLRRWGGAKTLPWEDIFTGGADLDAAYPEFAHEMGIAALYESDDPKRLAPTAERLASRAGGPDDAAEIYARMAGYALQAAPTATVEELGFEPARLEKALLRTEQLYPENWEASYWLVRVLLMQGRMEDAEAAYRREKARRPARQLMSFEDLFDARRDSKGKLARLEMMSRGHLMHAAVSPQGKLLAAAGADGDLSVKDLESGAFVFRRNLSAPSVQLLRWSADGRRLAAVVGNDRRGVLVLDARTWQPVYEGDCEKQLLNLALAPDGGRLLLRNEDALTVVSLKDGAEIASVGGRPGSAAFRGDGAAVWASTASGVREYSGHGGKLLREFTDPEMLHEPRHVLASPDGKSLHLVGKHFWRIDPTSGVATPVVAMKQRSAMFVVSRDGRWLAYQRDPLSFRLVDLEQRRDLGEWPRSGRLAGFSDDGKTLWTDGLLGFAAGWPVDQLVEKLAGDRSAGPVPPTASPAKAKTP